VVVLTYIPTSRARGFTLREVPYKRGRVKKRKLRRLIQLLCFLYKDEYRIFKLVEITIKEGTNVERRKIEGMNQIEL
jgi:hypothetical protein